MSIKNIFNDQGGTVPAETGGDSGAWTSLTPSDLSTDAQSYQTFSLSTSDEAGFDNQVSIANNAVGVFNNFPRNDVGVVYFDTGFSLDDLDNGDANNAVFQISMEIYNMTSGSNYQTDIGYPLGVCLFSSLSPPPFSSAPKGGFYGHGFLHTKSGSTLIANDAFVRRMRDQTTAGLRGTIYAYAAGIDLKHLVHTVTVAQGIDGSDNKTICLTQGDFMAYADKTSIPLEYPQTVIGQQQDSTSGFSNDSADTVILGVMFNLFIDTANGGVNPSPTKTWDFNLKWRKLNQS